jgi:hypothetical protein
MYRIMIGKNLDQGNKEGLHFGQGVKQILNLGQKDRLFHISIINPLN